MPFDTPFAQTSLFQRTLARPVALSDIGLHSGCTVNMRLLPSEANSGITFVRTDFPAGQGIIPARWDHVGDTRLCTVISNEFGARVSTVEHIMSALTGLGIDNCVIEIDNEETPAMDGSSIKFVEAIDRAGVMVQKAHRKVLEILRPVEIVDGPRTAKFMPAAHASYDVTVDYTALNMTIGKQSASLVLNERDYRTEVAAARSFNLFEEIEKVWSIGLGKGGSLDNNLIVWGDQIVNYGGLRFDTEFARHKLLDAVGDLALAGGPIMGAYSAYMTGHALNNQLLRAVFADSRNYRWVDAGSMVEAPRFRGNPAPYADYVPARMSA